MRMYNFYNQTIILDINCCTTLFTLAIQSVCASSEVALEPWRSCSLLASVLVQLVVLTEVSTAYISLEVWGHVTTNGQSVCMSWRRAHLGTCDQILILSEFRCVFFVGRSLWREVGSVSCQSLSAIIVHRQVFFFCFCFSPILHVIHFMYI
jgi:hypothetical protein